MVQPDSSASFTRVYSAAESRALDRCAIEEHGIPGIVLMKRAGQAAWAALLRHWPQTRSITVLCGRGNNAGDGYIVAGAALGAGRAVQLIQLGPATALTGDAARARDWAVASGVAVSEVSAEAPQFAIVGDVVVDALLGTGVKGAVRAGYAHAIDEIAACGAPVLALDIPSGLCSDTGRVLGSAVRAAATVTFIGMKRGLVTGAAGDYAGAVELATLDIPRACYDTVPGAPAVRWQQVRQWLPPREATAYKQRSGHVLVLGGDRGMGGAVALAAEAALRVGAGLVSAVTRPEHVSAILARRPEIMVSGRDDAGSLDALLERATVIAVGPGLGRLSWGQALFERACAAGRPLVIDADALHWLARQTSLPAGPVIITPHAGEAAALLGCSAAEVQQDRYGAVARLSARFGVAVLKGPGTLIADGDTVAVCMHGNAAMASAGMGDVLTGVVAGLLAQGMPPAAAATAGVCLHSYTADRYVTRCGPRGLLAGDLLEELVPVLNRDDA